MNDRQLRHFIVLGELLNFRKAAQRLGIVQPALSASIKRLEAELGATLFERSTRDVRLTAAGEAALTDVRKAVKHLESAKTNARASTAGTYGHLSIGFVGSASFSLLPRGVRSFRSQYPNVSLSLQESTSREILSLIEQEDLDLGLIRTPTERSANVEIAALLREHLIAVLPLDGPWAAKAKARSVSLEELSRAPFINFSYRASPMLHMAVVNSCREAGFLPNIVQEAIQVQTVITLVESGLGVGLVPTVATYHKPSNARFLKLTRTTPSSETGLAIAYNPSSLSAAGRRFVDTMLKVRRGMGMPSG